MTPEQAGVLAETPAGRVALIARLRRRLQALEQREAPMAERASVRLLLERIEHVHAMSANVQRLPMVAN